MNYDHQNTDLPDKIERYLDGNLTGEEKADFERQMKADSQLADDVEAYRAINFAIANKDYAELKNDLVKAKKLISDVRANLQVNYEVETEKSEPEVSVQRQSSRENETDVSLIDQLLNWLIPTQPAFRLALAVAVIAVLLIPAYMVFMGGSANHEQLFAENFAPYPDVISSSRGESDEPLDGLLEAMQSYENKNYSGALIHFNDFLNTNPTYYDALFYRGVTNLQLGNIEQAASDLESVMDNNRTLENQAKWYLALLHLKKGEVSEASEVLKEIEAGNGQYSDRAKSILKKLK